MKEILLKLVALSGLSFCFAMANAQKIVVGYAPNWNSDMFGFVDGIDYAKLTHIDVAFENPADDAGNLTFNSNDDLLVAKAHANNVKVLISIGGGDVAENKVLIARYFALQLDKQRAGFVAKLAAYVTQHNFDGLDVDLEGPAIGKDYGPFVADLSKALLPKGKLLTAAVGGYGGDQIPNSVFSQFSFMNIMAYDATGPWRPDQPGQHSSMDYTKSSVQYWLDRGLPKSKTVVGVPFYGYGFGKSFRQGDYSYSEIVTTFPGSELLDQIGDTIWYNGLPTIKAKAKYVVDTGLAGAMIWALNGDIKGEKSLLSALYQGLHS